MITELKGAKKLHLQIMLLLRAYILEQEKADITLQLKNIDEAIACSILYEKTSELRNV